MSSAVGLAQFVEGHLERFARSEADFSAKCDVESIHDFRVSCRRLNEPLGIIGEWVSRRKVRSAQRELKRLRRALSVVRDYDVVLASTAQGSAASHLGAEGLAQLDGILTARRARCAEKASRKVASVRPVRVARLVGELIAEFRGVVVDGECVLGAVQEVWGRRIRRVLANSPTGVEPRNLHPLRISVKKLRYCTELLYDLQRRSADSFLGRCREVQDRLGAWNDHLFAAKLCGRLATRSRELACQTGWCAEVLDYAESRARAADMLREDIIRFWPTAEAAILSLVPGESETTSNEIPSSQESDADVTRIAESAQ